MRGHLLAQIVCRRHKAYVCAGEEQHQTHICIQQTYQNSPQVAHGKLEADNLENAEKHDNWGKGHGDFFDIGG